MQRINIASLDIAEPLHRLLSERITPGLGVGPTHVWQELAGICAEFVPRNRELLARRDALQAQIDDWHRTRQGQNIDLEAYRDFLTDIGYLLPEGPDFQVTTSNVDAEIASIAGPQLVVPVDNARYAINASNARWGSLYDALYGTDVIEHSPGLAPGGTYNPARGARVIEFAARFLDQHFPLSDVGHQEVCRYFVAEQQLLAETDEQGVVTLADPGQFIGFTGSPENPSGVLLRHHGLHVEIQVDREHAIGKNAKAGVKDIVLEAAVTTIQDCEDSVAAVDAADKVKVYANWLGLMTGELTAEFSKGDQKLCRRLNPDRVYRTPSGEVLTLPGRSLLLVRNVGHLMSSDAVLLPDGSEIPEGILDTLFTSLIAMHDLRQTGSVCNSLQGSVYIVKPKMHGPEEVKFTFDLFARVEEALGLPPLTLKLGIMDEERRTTLNLGECIRIASNRLIFINTGFLDRTGDEIHTSMEAGPMVRKAAMKQQPWIQCYEKRNVAIGLAAGLPGHAQIGKGMWAMPDEMADMLKEKINHPRAGATTAWVPSPTAATLHALHYHQLDVREVQAKLAAQAVPDIEKLLHIPLLGSTSLTDEEIQEELDNNAQGILGYVVRWIDQGVGCSKVPDIHNIGLMEDRATLRISSQHIANWLHHGICSQRQVLLTLQKMAAVVDQQNAGDPHYHNMAPDFENSLAFQAACDLVFKGREQVNGYTEPVLHARRRQAKRQRQLS